MSSKSPIKGLKRQQSGVSTSTAGAAKKAKASQNTSMVNQSNLLKASEKVNLTDHGVEVEHLQGEIDLRQSKIDVTEDLKKQVHELKDELRLANETNKEKDVLIDSLHSTIA